MNGASLTKWDATMPNFDSTSVSNVGVVFALSGTTSWSTSGSLATVCAQPLVVCYYNNGSNGLVYMHGYSGRPTSSTASTASSARRRRDALAPGHQRPGHHALRAADHAAIGAGASVGCTDAPHLIDRAPRSGRRSPERRAAQRPAHRSARGAHGILRHGGRKQISRHGGRDGIVRGHGIVGPALRDRRARRPAAAAP